MIKELDPIWEERCKSHKDPKKSRALALLTASRHVSTKLIDDMVKNREIDESDRSAVMDLLAADAKELADVRAASAVASSAASMPSPAAPVAAIGAPATALPAVSTQAAAASVDPPPAPAPAAVPAAAAGSEPSSEASKAASPGDAAASALKQ
jgi:hypothetical protein